MSDYLPPPVLSNQSEPWYLMEQLTYVIKMYFLPQGFVFKRETTVLDTIPYKTNNLDTHFRRHYWIV